MKPAQYATGYGQPPSAAVGHQPTSQYSLPPWQQPPPGQPQQATSSHSHHRHHSASATSTSSRQHNPPAFGAAVNGASSAQQQQQQPGASDFGSSFGGAGGSTQGQQQQQAPYNYSTQYAQVEANRLEALAREQHAQQQQQQQHAAQHQQQQQLVQDRATLQHEQLRAQIRDQPPRVPLVDRDLFMLSLPSQDQPSYYDSASSAYSSDSETEAGRPSASTTTNRGHKLSSRAPHIRHGRLGAYPHTDAGFPAATSFSPSSKRRKLLSGLPSEQQQQQHEGGATSFALTPNLHLLPRGRPSLPAPAVLPPAPQSPLDLLLSSSMQYTLGPKNHTFKTLSMSATGLIEQEGPLIGSLSRVCAGLRGEGFEFRWVGDEEVRKEREKERAGEVEEERVRREKRRREEEGRRRERREVEERERKIREERERVEEVERRKKEVGEERERREKEEARVEAERVERELREKEERVEREKKEAEERDKEEEQAKAKAEIVEEQAAASAAAALKTDLPAASSTVEGANTSSDVVPAATGLPNDPTAPTKTGATVEGTTPVPELSAASLPALPLAEGALPPLPSASSPSNTNAMDVDPTPSTRGPSAAASNTPAASDAPPSLLSLGELPPLPAGVSLGGGGGGADSVPSVSVAGDGDEDSKMASATEGEEDRSGADEAAADDLMLGAGAAGGEEDEEDDDEDDSATTRRRSGRVALRTTRATEGDGGSTSDSGGEEGEDSDERAIRRIERAEEDAAGAVALSRARAQQAELEEDSLAGDETPPRVVEEELPEYAKRLVDPEVYVRSLFVSEGNVEMPSREMLQQQAAGMGAPPPGGAAAGATPAGMETLSPNEQEVLLHDCLTDLHRFLADSLEYRSRLAEIRDGVLGADRRRKGMWKVVRTVGQDWMDEEAQAAES